MTTIDTVDVILDASLADIARSLRTMPGADPSPADVIQAAPTNVLLDGVIRLTHRIHTATIDRIDDEARASLREMRDLARAEIVRRAGA